MLKVQFRNQLDRLIDYVPFPILVCKNSIHKLRKKIPLSLHSFLQTPKMNFNKILSQLNHVDLQNRLLDHKFMSKNTFEKKYKTKDIQQVLSSVHHPTEKKISESNKILLQNTKHRYFQDIELDQIEDANIFGYSTFEYFTYFKKNEAKKDRLTKRQAQRDAQKNKTQTKNIKNSFENDLQGIQEKEEEGSFNRPKTALVSRGTPTRRRVHHKLSLNQIEKVATSQNPLPSHMKQQYFTEEFFDFSSQQNQNLKFQNVRCGSRTGTFYKQFRPQTSVHEGKMMKTLNHFAHQNDLPKRHLMFQSTKTKFYQLSQNTKNLTKRQRKHLDSKKIKDQKIKFSRGVSCHFENLYKRNQPPLKSQNDSINVNNSTDLKSVVYERQLNNKRKTNQQIEHYSRSLKQKESLQHYPQFQNSPSTVIIYQQLQPHTNYENPLSYQSQLITQPPGIISSPQLFPSIKLFSDLSFIHSINSLLLQRSQLPDLQFKYDHQYTPLNYKIFDSVIIQNFNSSYSDGQTEFMAKSLQHFSVRSLSRMHKDKPKVYNIAIVICQTLEWAKLENVEIQGERFLHKGKQINLLLIVEKLLKNHLPSDFVHLIITRTVHSQQKQKSSPQQPQQLLVFQTFIHNSDIKYFQGRQVQIQYFKYFFKRFITFDRSILKKDQIESSISLILQSEVKTPPQFQDFCQEMKVKDNLNIIALRNLDTKDDQLAFRCVQISLSKLLTDANETVMMVKKELFEGYDWRGVSLTKGAKQFRGYHLQHFYI